MSQSIIDAIKVQLYDLNDDMKAGLSELNQNKQLVINGPDHQLIKRGFDISYYQGQKQAIDTIHSLLEQIDVEEDLVQRYSTFVQEEKQLYKNNLSESKNIYETKQELNEFIAIDYKLKGTQTILTVIDTIMNEHYKFSELLETYKNRRKAVSTHLCLMSTSPLFLIFYRLIMLLEFSYMLTH